MKLIKVCLLLTIAGGCGGEAQISPAVLSDLSLDKRTLQVGEVGQATFKIADADGSLGGATIHLDQTHEGGTHISADAALLGATDGLIGPVGAALAFGLSGMAPPGKWTMKIMVIEANGTESNTLSSTITLTQ